jgi:hypothetical protein
LCFGGKRRTEVRRALRRWNCHRSSREFVARRRTHTKPSEQHSFDQHRLLSSLRCPYVVLVFASPSAQFSTVVVSDIAGMKRTSTCAVFCAPAFPSLIFWALKRSPMCRPMYSVSEFFFRVVLRATAISDGPPRRTHPPRAFPLGPLSIFGALKTSAQGLQLLFEAFAEGKKWVDLRKILCG